MTIDAHQHFWKLSRGDYGFPRKDDPQLYRDFLPHDIEAHLRDAGVDATIAVQATESVAETEFLLGLPKSSPFIAGVVGWCDLQSGTSAVCQLETLATQGPLVGIRPMLQAHDEASWLLSDDARPALDAMVAMDLAFDALVDVRHLGVMDQLADTFPDLHIIVDHLAKPWRDAGQVDNWEEGMRRLSGHSKCWVKLSGLPAMNAKTPAELSPKSLIDFAMTTFGTEKLIWGSDWPVSLRQGAYRDSFQAVRDNVEDHAKRKVFVENSKCAYRLTL